MTALEKIYSAYINHEFESSSGLTPDFAAFASGVKKAIKKDCEAVGLELAKFSRGHFDVTAFVHNPATDKLVYVSIGDMRGGCCGHPLDQVLYRSAEHLKDYRGGCNNFTSLPSLVECAKSLTER